MNMKKCNIIKLTREHLPSPSRFYGIEKGCHKNVTAFFRVSLQVALMTSGVQRLLH